MRPRGHAQQAEATFIARRCGVRRGSNKTHPIIFDREDYHSLLERQPQYHVTGGGMLVDILERLLSYPEEGRRRIGLQRTISAVQVKLGCQGGVFPKSCQFLR
jgi:hypothetical protein